MDFMTLWLFEQAKNNPEKICLIEEKRNFSFSQMERMVRQAVYWLNEVQVKPGDHVAIRAKNSVHYFALLHAIPRLGAVGIPLNIRLPEPQIQDQLQRSDATILIEDKYHHLDTDLQRIGLEDLFRPYEEEEYIEVYNDAFASWNLNREFAIFFTSGTTGRPKGAVLTLSNVYHNAIGSRSRLGIVSEDIWIITLPMYHVGGMSIVIRGAIYGIGARLLTKFDIDKVCKAIEAGGTILSLVSTMLHRFIKEGKTRDLAKLRCLLLGGAKANQSLVERVLKEGIPLYTTYGLTEASSQVATATPEEVGKYPGTVGYPIEGVEVKILGEKSEIGDILIKGPTIMKGYYKEEQETAESFKDGWFITGDLGRLEGGRLFTFGRRGDLIICGGENIYPAEIESCLQKLEGVKEVCVVGVPDEEWGEVVGLAVVPESGTENLEQLKQLAVDMVSKELGGFKRPRKFVFMEKLPKTASGKVKRGEILDLFLKKR